jgi:hypothetical protein
MCLSKHDAAETLIYIQKFLNVYYLQYFNLSLITCRLKREYQRRDRDANNEYREEKERVEEFAIFLNEGGYFIEAQPTKC